MIYIAANIVNIGLHPEASVLVAKKDDRHAGRQASTEHFEVICEVLLRC